MSRYARPFLLKEENPNTDLHSVISPAEVRVGEKVSAKVFIQSQTSGRLDVVPLRVWRISPLGIELLVNEAISHLGVGDVMDLEVQVGANTSKLNGVVVADKHREENRDILGIRLCSDTKEEWSGAERRTSRRWTCSHEFLPVGMAPNPGRYNDFLYFRVVDISSQGVLFVTSLRNKFLIPGMTLDASLSFPMIGQVTPKLEIASVRIRSEEGKSTLAVGCKFKKISDLDRGLLAQYIFQFGPSTTVAELKQEGLYLPNAGSGIDFRFVKTEADYRQVLELRKTAYAAVGKLANEDDVSDIYDSRSRIIIGVYKGQVVASMRLIFNESEDQMEHEQFLTFPAEFPRKDEICEITRVCTHPDFRGSDVLMGLFRFAAITVVQSGRYHIMGCATKELLPLYLRIGCRSTGLTYTHKQLNNVEHTVFIGNVLEAMTGKNINPIAWNVVWADASNYLVETDSLSTDPMANFRMGMFKLLRPISFFAARRARRPKRKSKAAS